MTLKLIFWALLPNKNNGTVVTAPAPTSSKLIYVFDPKAPDPCFDIFIRYNRATGDMIAVSKTRPIRTFVFTCFLNTLYMENVKAIMMDIQGNFPYFKVRTRTPILAKTTDITWFLSNFSLNMTIPKTTIISGMRYCPKLASSILPEFTANI